MTKKIGEPQYQKSIEEYKKRGNEQLGLMSSWSFNDDPKRLAFTLARYKFVSKMFYGFDRVLEVGCGDCFGSRLVAQTVGHLTAIDFDSDFVDSAKTTMSIEWPFVVFQHNILEKNVKGKFNGVYCLDVLEHIKKSEEPIFFRNILSGLERFGSGIFGLPSLESQKYASAQSKQGHVNCMTQPDLRATLEKYFHNVFLFSMNDEVLHTGYHKMSQYNFALCCNKRNDT